MKSFLPILLILLLSTLTVRATPSDSIDTWHYDIHIDTLNYGTTSLKAHTTISYTSKFNGMQTVELDLLKLTVDSVLAGNTPATFTYNDTLLSIHLPGPLNQGDSAQVTVWYHGKPVKDPSGFGGFYFNSNPQYVYNIGVGFQADPHTFGRVWFPCKDNFTDKALYDYHVRVLTGKVAVCGGTLQNEIDNGDGTTTFHWKMRDPVPTYLASMAIADFIAVRDTFVSITGDSIPVALYVRASDSAGTLNSFQRLHIAFDAFENRMGPYRWERVGYVGVPFNAGAMEHATNIAYPNGFLNAGSAYETIMAHELSHSWFGNLVTCVDAPEMWLNEGLAAYSEALFTEAAYGSTAYTNYVRANHSSVLRYTYITDGGYLAVSGVGHNYTYGSTVYDKGALIGHTLRGYLGDVAFFNGIKQYMTKHAFANASSDTLKKVLTQVSGVNMDNFFKGWVKQPGFPHFQIDSIEVSPVGSNYQVAMHIRQRQKATGIFFDNVKTKVTFMDANWNSIQKNIDISGPTAYLAVTIPFAPTVAMFDLDERMADAAVDNYYVFQSSQTHAFPETYCSVTTTNVPDSALVRVIHNWIAPDDFKNPPPGVRLSGSRYWKVQGIFPTGFSATATFDYSARVSSTPSLNHDAFLDHTWFNTSEDSLLLFYRPNSGAEWQVVSNYTLNTGTLVDKRGSATVASLLPGEYTFGVYDYSLVLDRPEPVREEFSFICYPNPSQGSLNLQLPHPGDYGLQIYSLAGRKLVDMPLKATQSTYPLNLTFLEGGIYLLRLTNEQGLQSSARIVLE
ncbi:MAG: T9SS type A sorting domain-containing protein [Bacteroidia bacterium]|nr:T9SS type A sorting domain-containing protein [Bacteroidia bacterium]